MTYGGRVNDPCAPPPKCKDGAWQVINDIVHIGQIHALLFAGLGVLDGADAADRLVKVGDAAELDRLDPFVGTGTTVAVARNKWWRVGCGVDM
jgi:hypothetical protein